jgi:hypothetical protein
MSIIVEAIMKRHNTEPKEVETARRAAAVAAEDVCQAEMLGEYMAAMAWRAMPGGWQMCDRDTYQLDGMWYLVSAIRRSIGAPNNADGDLPVNEACARLQQWLIAGGAAEMLSFATDAARAATAGCATEHDAVWKLSWDEEGSFRYHMLWSDVLPAWLGLPSYSTRRRQ